MSSPSQFREEEWRLVTGLTDAVEWYTYMYEFSEEELDGMEPVHTDDEILDAILRGDDDES